MTFSSLVHFRGCSTTQNRKEERLNPTLLEKSASNSQGNDRSKCNRTPDDIKRELDKALKDSFHTSYGGCFLVIPYLLHFWIVEKINSLRVAKQSGIPVEKAVFAGSSKMPDPSFFHDFDNGFSVIFLSVR